MKAIMLAVLVITFAGCGGGMESVAIPVRTSLQVAKDRGLVAMAFGKYAKLSAFTRKLTNDGKPAPPIDKKPRAADDEKQAANDAPEQSSLATVASEKPKTPEKPVVFVYLTDDFPPERKTICPACIAWAAWWDQLSTAQRDALPLRFERLKKIPACAKDWARPAFHWVREGDGCKTEGWTDWATFESIWKQPPAEPMEADSTACANPDCSCLDCQCNPCKCGQPQSGGGCGPNGCGKHGRRRAAIVPRPVVAPTVQAAVHSISRDYVNQLLAVFGKGEVRLTDQASMIVPANVGVTITRTGDQVAAVLSEPFPVVRYRTWGLRFDDTLRGATVDPQQAAIHLGRYGTVKFAVE